MPKHNAVMPEKELPEQEQRAVAVSAGDAANQNTWRNIGLIIGREYKGRVTQRSFIISTIVMLMLVVIGACAPTIIQYFTSISSTQTNIVVVNNAGTIAGLNGDGLARVIGTVLNGTTDQATSTNTPGQHPSGKSPFAITIQTSDALNDLQNRVKNGSLNILLVLVRGTNQDLHFTYYTNADATSDTNLPKIQAVAQQLNFLDTSHRLGLTQTQTNSLFAQPGFTVVNTGQGQNTNSKSDIVTGYILAYAGNVLIYMAVLLYGMGVATGVAEEKSSRIMEILVNAATPFQLMVGKIIGIGAAGLTQMTCFVAVGIGTLLLQSPLQTALFGASSGGLSLNITGVSITFLLLLLLYFILGFLLYATLYAAMGALVKRQDEVQNAVAPLTWLFAIGYIVSFFGIYTPDATWMKVISYVPFWTPTTMLVRIGVNGVAGWEIAMTIALMIVAIFACAWISARIYRFGVLMYGQRPGLGQLAKLVRMK
ncbi:MAG: ABC transporter permease [Ktedonobacteraceae bacterium]